VGKQLLSWCGGACKEASAKTELYNPVKLNPVAKKSSIRFSRVSYCLNHGCGWRQSLPEVEVSIETATEDQSEGIRAYLRDAQKRYPQLLVKSIWVIWANLNVLRFEDYLKEMASRKN
jgi:hypothetical protein